MINKSDWSMSFYWNKENISELKKRCYIKFKQKN